jgi:mannosyltransferase
MAHFISARQVDIIATNIKYKYTGVTSTILALLPTQSQQVAIAALGHMASPDWPQTTLLSLLRHGYSPTASGKPFRIWHARRNNEMILGVLLRDLLRLKLKLVFTSAAQRQHTSLTRWLLRRMDEVIAVSPEAAQYLHVPHQVIMHGIDTSKYHLAEDRREIWTQTGLPGRYAIGCFGRVRHQKGTDRFVDSMIELLPKYPDYTAIIIGQTTANEAGFKAQLEAKINAAGLDKRIIFLGLRPAEEIPLWLRRCSIVVGPQRWEGFGLVPAEAMASGAAVVATAVGAARHLIVEGQTGYLIPAEDTATLTAAIGKLMANPQLSEQMGIAGRAHILANFSIQREASGINAVYEKLWQSAKPL